MKTNINGVNLYYTIDGSDGPWITMSHSLCCSTAMWDEQADLLKQRYRVLRFDTRGHGHSDAPAGAYTLESMAEDLAGLLRSLNVSETHFVGLSMGGMIGMTFALLYPGVFKSLVLCDTTSRIPPEAGPVWAERIQTASTQGMEALVQPTLKRWFTEPFMAARPDAMQRVGNMIRSTPVPGYVGCCHAISKLDCTDRLQSIKCPVQIIVGEQDVGTPVEMSRAIQRATPGSELVVIPSASHLSNIEQPAVFNDALGGFLARQ
jgi:3-oxoadipate enol-lactonase